MSFQENTRVTDAIAKNVGIRWCSSCQMDKPEPGFKKISTRWVCPGCQLRRRPGSRAAS